MKENAHDVDATWFPVLGFAGYEVSSCGKLRSTPRTNHQKNRWGETPCVRSYPSVVLKPEENKGYLRYRMKRCGRSKAMLAHRLVALAFLPNPENKPHVNHKNGNKHDNRVDNLEWVTAKENEAHSRSALGKRSYNSKLSPDEIREMRMWWNTGDVTYSDIAKTWGVSLGNARAVCLNLSWKHVA